MLYDFTNIEEVEKENHSSGNNKLLIPFVVRGGVKNWKAIASWSADYLIKIAGNLPVKIKPKADHVNGKSTRETEEQKVILLKDAIELIFNENSPALSYVRESDLLSRCRQLAADITAPVYLANSRPHAVPRTGSPDPKIWIGPSGTVAQLHWDPEHNFYAQVKGRKRVILAAPNEYLRTYPNSFSIGELSHRTFFHRNEDLLHKLQKCSTSFLATTHKEPSSEFKAYLKQELSGPEVSLLCDFLAEVNNCNVNAETPDLISHPAFSEAKRYEVILEPGDLLFIPYFWFHYLRSLEPSISVNWFFLPENLAPTIAEDQPLDILLSHLTL